MAGAGYKQFADGDVLTAAQVQTFLQDQAVMRFADSSARDTALGTAVAEGMLAYLDDTDEVLFYDGSAWGAVGLPLGTATPTDGQFLSFGTATSTWNPVEAPGNAGIGSNVVSVTKTDQFSTTSTSFVDITGLTATINVTDASSKVLVQAFAEVGNNSGTGAVRFVLTDSSNNILLQSTGSGIKTLIGRGHNNAGFTQLTQASGVSFLVTPGAAGNYTVKARLASAGPSPGTSYFGRPGSFNGSYQTSSPGAITLIEVAG